MTHLARSTPSSPFAVVAVVGVLVTLTPMQAQAQGQAQTDAVPAAADASLLSQILGTKTDVTVGLGAGIDQRYMGGRNFRPLIVPLLTVSRGIFFLDTVRGAGIQYQSPSGFYIGNGINYDSGRDDRNDWLRAGSNDLKSSRRVKGTVTDTTTISQQIAPWFSVNAQAELGLDGHKRGNQYQLGIENIAFKKAKETITFDLDAKIGDGQYNDSYFGAQPSARHNTGYTPGFGVYGYSLSATWDHKINAHWSTELILGTVLYTNKVADSPIVQRRFGLTVLPSVSYSF